MGNSQTRHVRPSTNLKTHLKTPRDEKNYSSTADRFNPLLPPTHTSQNRLPTENLKSHPSSADLESRSSEKPREKPRGINARNVTSSLTIDKHSTLIVKAQKSNKSLDGSSQDVPTQAQNNSPYETQVDPRSLLVALIGEKPTLRSCLRIAVMLAKEHRDVSGKFRKHERHACMELYETLGLEEDEMFGPPNELQSQLRQYVFPPPNMHLLKDVAVIDDETMDLILGPEEGALRRSLMGPEQYSVRERRKSSDAMPDSTSTRRAGISSESTFKDGVEAARLGASAAYKCLPKNKEQTAMLTKAMASCVLFKDLDDRDTKILFDSFELELFNADEVVFEKGDDGERFYMISEGMCRIDLPAGPVFLRKGATFGELGILYGTPRAATITACDPSALWFIDRDTYRSVLMRQTLKKRDLHMHFLNSVRILDSMEEYEKARISDTLQSQYAEEGTVICSEGEAGEAMYFIEEGTIQVSAKSGLRTEIQAGGYFGELALLLQCPRKATCIAVTPCRLLRLNRQDFTNALGPLESILRRNLSHYETYITKVTKK